VAVIELTAKDSGAAVASVVGDRVRIELNENPTTGYRWCPRAASSLLRPIDDDYTPAGEGSIGGGGTRTLVYEAVAAGTGSLELELIRAWETPPTPLHTFSIELDVS
jgi:inhibitor of cysteine peptidase